MNKVSEILDYGLLSEMAYLKLEDDRFKENNKYIGVPIGEYRLSEQGSLRKKDDVISFLTYLLSVIILTLQGSFNFDSAIIGAINSIRLLVVLKKPSYISFSLFL